MSPPPAGSLAYWTGERASLMAITGILLPVAGDYRDPRHVPQVSGWIHSGRRLSEKPGARARGEEGIVGELGAPPVALDPVEAVQDDLPEQGAELEAVA